MHPLIEEDTIQSKLFPTRFYLKSLTKNDKSLSIMKGFVCIFNSAPAHLGVKRRKGEDFIFICILPHRMIICGDLKAHSSVSPNMTSLSLSVLRKL
jgi:hypothetical protein